MLKAIRHGRLAPLFECGFRPFFLLTAATAVLAVAAWAAFWLLGTPLPSTPGGPVVWHAHELLFGFALASVVGFTLTSIPEFTSTPEFGRERTLALLLLWVAGRIAFAGSAAPWLAILAMLADLGLLCALLAMLAPRLLADPEHRHRSFLWVLGAMIAATAGFHVDSLAGAWPMRWLLVMVGLLMSLIVIAMSRISMRIVNAALEDVGNADTEYLARPPRRNLAIVCILLYTAAEFVAPGHPVSGWVALASAAALLNLTNDWHVGRALLRRWPFMLYLVYWFMALGYATIGAGILAGQPWTSAGRHLLMIGAMGLAIFAVLNIAGRIHAGVEPDTRAWVPAAVGLVVAAAIARAAMGLGGLDASVAIMLASACWVLAFGLHLGFHWKVLVGPRTDGQHGCAGLAEDRPPPPDGDPPAGRDPASVSPWPEPVRRAGAPP